MAGRVDADILFPQPRDFSLKKARVREVSRAIAWKVISRYEWLGTLPFGCGVLFGIFFDGDVCGGVACYEVPWAGAGTKVPIWLGADPRKIAYLARGACVHWAPVGTAPKLINWSARLVADKIGSHVAIAYSDTDAGEIGTVYQAAGWVCLGRGTRAYEVVTPQGRVYNRAIYGQVAKDNRVSFAEARRAMLALGWREQPDNPKWRYGLILPPGEGNLLLRSRFEVSRTPYPKRDSADGLSASARGGPPGDQSGEGGSSPTRTLHIDAEQVD